MGSWRSFGLKPHLVETWKLSTDPEFIAKVRDVVDPHMNPRASPCRGGGREVADPCPGPHRAGPACPPVLPATPALNLVERWFAELTSHKIRRSACCSVTGFQSGHPQVDQRVEQVPRSFAWATALRPRRTPEVASLCR
jgi:hypothetical protein